MIKIETFTKSVSSNSSEDLKSNLSGTELTPASGKVIDVKEIGGNVTSDGRIKVFIEGEQITSIKDNALASVENRILIDWSIAEGEELKIVGEDQSGSSNEMNVTLVFNEHSA